MKTNRIHSSPEVLDSNRNITQCYRIARLLFLFILIIVTVGYSQQEMEVNRPESLDRILHPDGSINIEQAKNRSYSSEGFKMNYGEYGQPVFIEKRPAESVSHPDDARWDDKFGLGGFDGYINAMAIAPNGNIYVGGDFVLVNGIIFNGIAMWDGANWHPLGAGLTGGWRGGTVFAITIDGDKIYVGGDFTVAGEVQANRIAIWDGAEWNNLGTGMDSEVYAIAVDGDNVYAGGYRISEAGGISVNSIARWDGQNWNAMGSGLTYNSRPNDVFAIVAKNDTVYAGGGFQEAGEDTINSITYWDGNKWNAMGSGMDRKVEALAFGNGVLYAGGQFKQAGGETANYIAQWNGNKWSSVGKGVSWTVSTIEVKGTELYLGGRFTKADTIEALRIVKWDGEKWYPFEGGPDNDVNALVVSGKNVYIGGEFREVNGKEEKYFTQWDGQNWSAPGKKQDQSVNGEVYTIAIDGSDVYVGGQFFKAGLDTVNNIAKWDGKNWSALGDGVDGKVSAIAVDNGNVYVGGAFAFAGDLLVRRIAKWDGEKWNALGTGMNNQVYAVAVHGEDVYVGGNFTSADTCWARRIARWDGTKWHALGGDGSLNGAGGLDGYPNSYVTSIEVERDTVYIGGYFGRAFYQDGDGYVTVRSVAKWDGEKWHAAGSFGNIVQQLITSIAVDKGIIYATGTFPRAGMPKANKVVRWDGVEWSDVGDEMYHTSNSSTGGRLNALAVVEGKIYVGGQFDLVGDKTVYYIAEWNGQEWLSLGSGVNEYVYSLAADSDYLYAGGRFKIAGNKGSSRFGRYNISGAVGIKKDKKNIVNNYNLYQNYPNPFNPSTKIQFQLPKSSKVKMEIFNTLGQKVDILLNRNMNEGFHEIEFNAHNLASGIYFYMIQAGEYQNVKKMIFLK